jgi:hypothetical protein
LVCLFFNEGGTVVKVATQEATDGSVLGPSLFLYYINDIPTELDSTIRLFTDDTIAYQVIKANSDALTLQRDFNKLAQWEQLWKMAFHSDKCNGIRTDLVQGPSSGALQNRQGDM